ncbi:MazG family protein [Oceanotoga sp. DSM 15011]|jgi:tetrapyrrole methylase family protein/MazG family protein|uniref:MazG family protein n=1 Tax=unclassified Oceanotoga TaxID=2618448 RepID=UPI0021F4DC68|nr:MULTISPECIES: MazG family protein [unclassified Oceanotoga]MDN5342066.1 tetrapyrrole methylase family protein / MazG family protein [Oceanotoga sp.]UYP00032.1 MazG family protein [Oceanotoga sp. DSM 15011]
MDKDIINNLEELFEVMIKLRSKNGCEWDRKQTIKSLKPYIIEESYEVAQAIENEDYEELKDELGDVLLQIIFQSIIAEEEKKFDFSDIIKSVTEKMIRRHPHVFEKKGEYSYENWENIKAKEKNHKKQSSLGELKNNLPPILKLRRIIDNSKELGINPYKDENLKEIMINNIKKDNFSDFFEVLLFYLSENKLQINEIINESAKNYYEKFINIEKMLNQEIINNEKNFIKLWKDKYGEEIK